jgi:hypothetical protein
MVKLGEEAKDGPDGELDGTKAPEAASTAAMSKDTLAFMATA